MRRLDWPEQLAAQIESARARPFVWGTHDCVLWACDVVAAMTGVDPGAAFRGRYTTAAGALRTLGELGGDFRAAIQAVCEAHGYPEIPPPLAQRGDAVLMPSGVASWPFALGICVGRQAAVTGPDRVDFLPMSAAVAAWRI